jgi:hypothetical protein
MYVYVHIDIYRHAPKQAPILGWQLSACGAVFCKHVKKTIFYHFRKAKKKAKPQKTQKTMVQKHQKNVKH